ncbi:hypothetical protein AB4Z27_06025 [Cupriavidus sp. KB_39]|jgi:hypothetical protein|uniref:hypothetical protein n=1 Tax=Cupriavidus sp. KB_39 TaxID=3233036 RepID=UPI003F924E76
MKKLPLLLALIANAAFAQTAYVTPPGTRKVGDTIETAKSIFVLHESAPCSLPIANAKHMRKAELYNAGVPAIGCWGTILSATKGDYVIIGPYGNISKGNLVGFSKVKLQPNGNGVIIDGWPGM